MSDQDWRVLHQQGPDLDPALLQHWRDLQSQASDTTLFTHPDWVLPWFRAFGANKHLHLFAIEHQGRLVGLAPLVWSELRRGPDFFAHHYAQAEDLPLLRYRPRTWFRLRQLSVAANLQSGNIRGGWLFAPGFEHSGLRVLMRHLAEWPQWDLLSLPSWKTEMTPLLAQQVGLAMLHRYRHDLYGLTPRPWERYYAERGRRFRKRHRGVQNRLNALGDHHMFSYTDAQEIRAHLDDFFALARRCWKAAPQKDQSVFVAISDESEGFYRDLCSRLARHGQCQLYALYLEGEMIGALLCLTDKHVAYAMQTYYDPRFAAVSPGRFPIQAMIDWCGQHDIHWVDLNGNSPAALSYMEQAHAYDQVALFRKRGLLYWVAAAKDAWDRLRGNIPQRQHIAPEDTE